jgi:hypothetical protein
MTELEFQTCQGTECAPVEGIEFLLHVRWVGRNLVVYEEAHPEPPVNIEIS